MQFWIAISTDDSVLMIISLIIMIKTVMIIISSNKISQGIIGRDIWFPHREKVVWKFSVDSELKISHCGIRKFLETFVKFENQ